MFYALLGVCPRRCRHTRPITGKLKLATVAPFSCKYTYMFWRFRPFLLCFFLSFFEGGGVHCLLEKGMASYG